MTEKTRVSGFWLKMQDFLTENPEFPQYTYQGKYKLGIQLPNRDLTKKQCDQMFEFMHDAKGMSAILIEVISAAVKTEQTETKNGATANHTRSPNGEKTMRDAWLKALKDGNFAVADRMLARDEENVELYGVRDVQLDKKRKEYADAKVLHANS